MTPLDVTLIAFALASCSFCAWQTFNSTPRRVQRHVDELAADLGKYAAAADALEVRVEKYLEEIGDYAESIERKRRRIAQIERRSTEAGEAPGQVEDIVEGAKRLARQQGYTV